MRLCKLKYFIVVLMLIINFKSAKAIYIERVCLDKSNNITIIWSQPTPPCDEFIYYRIYGRDYEINSFVLIKEISDFAINSYVDLNAGATSNQWDYYIEYKYKCGNEIIEISDTVSVDKDAPKIVQIDSVSVIDGCVSIGWTKSESTDTKGYIIYYVDGNDQNIQIGYLEGRDSTLFIDSITGEAKKKAEQYRIVAIDSCENFSSISFGHKSIFLNMSQDSCQRMLSLSWSHYSAWNVSFRKYEILVSKNGGTYKILIELSGENNNYNVLGLENETDYSFIIRAKNTNKNITASSNDKNTRTNYVESPDYVYLSNVTVDGERIEISWITQQTQDIKEYRLYKGELGESIKLYNTIVYTTNSASYIDDDVDIYNKIYNYQVSVVDLCGIEVKKSNVAGNILLIKDENDDGTNLKWNVYRNWDAGVEKQFLYVEVDQIWSIEEEMGKIVNKYTSGLKVTEMKGYEKCFYVEDIELEGNKYSTRGISKSNTICLTGDLIAHWPNAFTPNSGYLPNRTFLPIGMLINYEKSEMIIYNSWGEEVYRKIGIEEGWDGMINGNMAQIGTYYYYATLIGKNEKSEKFSGTFHLLK